MLRNYVRNIKLRRDSLVMDTADKLIAHFNAYIPVFIFCVLFVFWLFYWLELSFILLRKNPDMREMITKVLQLVILTILLLFIAFKTNY